MEIAFSEIEDRFLSFNSAWQGYRALEARFAKASTILFLDLGTWDTLHFANWEANAWTRVRN